jgi:hypothetical protein
MRVIQVATVLLAALVAGQLHAQSATAAEPSAASSQPLVRQSPQIRTLNGFVENKGQWPDEVLFFARYGRIDLTLLPDALVFRPQPDRETGDWPAPLVLRLPHGVTAEGEGVVPTQHNFLIGAIRASHARGFERVVYHNVSPGIDLAVHIGAQGFEYDVNAAPGADLSDLVLSVDGANSLSIENGVLIMQTDAGRVEQRIGAAWQTDASGVKAPVASRFSVLAPESGAARLGFDAPGRDPTRGFVLDPSLVFSTFVGGSGQDLLEDMHVTPDGSAYLTARDYANAPTVPSAYQTTAAGEYDAWVGKLSPDGSTLEWGTFLGGSNTDDPFGVDVDQDGTVVVMGDTFASNFGAPSDFPTTVGSLQPIFAGGNDDLFITRLTPDGSGLVWSTFYDGASSEIASTMRLFGNGDVLIVSEPYTADPPSTAGAFDTVFVPGKDLLARISSDGAHLEWQTYLGALVSRVVPSSDGDFYFGGDAGALFPATPGTLKSSILPGDGDGIVGKMSGDGSHLYWGTFLGGDLSFDGVTGIACDASGAVYVCGTTNLDFPVTQGAFDVTSGHNFVAKLLPNGTGLVWSTFLTGCCGGTTTLFDVDVDSAGNAFVSGGSNQPNFPTTAGAYQPFFNGGSDNGHLTKFDALGESLVYSTYFGGTSAYIERVGLDAAQDPVLGLFAGSSMPTTAGAYDKSYNGGGDIGVAKFDFALLPWKVLGGGLKGVKDVPDLAGTGALVPGSTARFVVRGAEGSSMAFLIAGLTQINAPFKNGTLVPAPDILLPMATSPAGAIDLSFTWPAAPRGVVLTVQFWFKGTGEVVSWSASNALQLTSQ